MKELKNKWLSFADELEQYVKELRQWAHSLPDETTTSPKTENSGDENPKPPLPPTPPPAP